MWRKCRIWSTDCKDILGFRIWRRGQLHPKFFSRVNSIPLWYSEPPWTVFLKSVSKKLLRSNLLCPGLEHNTDPLKVFTLKTRLAFVVHSHLTFDRYKPRWYQETTIWDSVFYAFRIRKTIGLNLQFGKFPRVPAFIGLLFHILQLANVATVALPHLPSSFCKMYK